MRDIKFRAWDTAYNKMVESHLIPGFKLGITFTGEVIGFDADEESEDIESVCVYPIRFIIMQYTDLEDKNGPEIYESDIVQFTAFGRTVRGLVEWDDDDGLPGFVIVDIDGSGTIWDFMYDDLTVIGNRYETPELLEATT